MHEFSSNVNKVNKAVAKVRTIGDRLPLTAFEYKVFQKKRNQLLLEIFHEIIRFESI